MPSYSVTARQRLEEAAVALGIQAKAKERNVDRSELEKVGFRPSSTFHITKLICVPPCSACVRLCVLERQLATVDFDSGRLRLELERSCRIVEGSA